MRTVITQATRSMKGFRMFLILTRNVGKMKAINFNILFLYNNTISFKNNMLNSCVRNAICVYHDSKL